jgi:hypothetical protein
VLGYLVLTVDALGVDLEQDGDAVSGPLRDLGGLDTPIQPCPKTIVPPVRIADRPPPIVDSPGSSIGLRRHGLCALLPPAQRNDVGSEVLGCALLSYLFAARGAGFLPRCGTTNQARSLVRRSRRRVLGRMTEFQPARLHLDAEILIQHLSEEGEGSK